MSLINQMLKDLEKRRSRDLETSEALSRNISWESPRNRSSFNWQLFLLVITLTLLLAVIGYLLWERSMQPAVTPAVVKKTTVKKNNATKAVETKKSIVVPEQPVIAKSNVEENVEEDVDVDHAVDVEAMDDTPAIPLQKTRRPLNAKQQAEVAYQKGVKFLQQGRMREGKESLQEALSIYIPHIKAREMLAGIYIKSGHLISAAELLSEGVKVAPDYPLFAKLYARVLLEQNKPALAVQILERGAAAAMIDQEADYYALLAATYQRVNQHNKAVDIYLQLVKIHPDQGVWWLGLGISLEKSGKNSTALEAYRRAQKTGSLNTGLASFAKKRVAALTEAGGQ